MGVAPAKAVVALAPSILALPAVGVTPAAARLSVVGAPPPFQHQATYVFGPLLVPPLSPVVNPLELKELTPS